MLPTLTIAPADVYQVMIALFEEGRQRVVGQTYAYQFKELRDAVISSGENMDTFLTKYLVRGINMKPVKRKLLFWYAPHSEFTFLTVCDRNLKEGCFWLADIPGRYDQGQDYVRYNGRPFAYWDGQNLYRVYLSLEEPKEGVLYICDFGSLLGLTVEATDKETYTRIRNDKAGEWDYSAVPTQEDEILSIQGKKYVLSHAFLNFIPGEQK